MKMQTIAVLLGVALLASCAIGSGAVVVLLFTDHESKYAELQRPQSDQAPGWMRNGPIQADGCQLFDGDYPIGDPCILQHDGRFKMWFTNILNPNRSDPILGISYCESRDGVRWSEPTEHLLAPTPGGWDAQGVETVSVLQAPNGEWLMYYTGDRPPEEAHHMAIGMAKSPDGRKWTKHGTGPVFDAENNWEKPFRFEPNQPLYGGVGEPSVVYDGKTQKYRMWYAALGKHNDGSGWGGIGFRIGYAESKDGILWNRRPDPVLGPPPGSAWDSGMTSHPNVLIDKQGQHHLFYFGCSLKTWMKCEELGGVAQIPGAIGHATSDDGVQWTRDRDNPILSPGGKTWEGWTLGGPSAVELEDQSIRLWYFANSTHASFNGRIGMATWKRRQ